MENHGIIIDENDLFIGSVDPDSPFAVLPLDHVHEILEFDNYIAIVLPNSIVFLNKNNSEVHVHVRLESPSIWENSKAPSPERTEIFNRTALLTGLDYLEDTDRLRGIVFGMGGVGSWAAETLVRSGFSKLTIVDADVVAVSNINRQLPATVSTVGRVKVDVMKERLLAINPDAEITAVHDFYNASTCQALPP